ncbi:MAG: hypothetical protein KJP00_10520 [Bacteroidia bacterium]|nr:hypothetical protein [Bacteroidia bacterium]
MKNSGLRIENAPTRGLGFTDSLGMKYGMVYITTTIINDTTIPIDLQFAFSQEYDYPTAYGEEQYNVILLSKEWGLNGVEITDSMINELPKFIDKPYLDKTLKPNEECVETIGILRPSRANLCSASPYAILEYSDRGNFPLCEWAGNQDQESNPSPKAFGAKLALGLQVGFCTVGGQYESCKIIPCGHVSYPEN